MKYSNSPNAYINAQELEVALVKATTYGDALKVFREAPSIEIVRCGECIWKDTRRCIVHFFEDDLKADDFCSYGERRG